MGTCPALVLWNWIPGRCLTDLPSSAVRYSSQELQDIDTHEDAVYKPERQDCAWLAREALPIMSARMKQQLITPTVRVR